MSTGSHALQPRDPAGLAVGGGEKGLKPEGLAFPTCNKTYAAVAKSLRVLLVRLTEEGLNWIAEISASVVRNNQLRKIPKDWRKLPEW
jgi:hypothetical protein